MAAVPVTRFFADCQAETIPFKAPAIGMNYRDAVRIISDKFEAIFLAVEREQKSIVTRKR